MDLPDNVLTLLANEMDKVRQDIIKLYDQKNMIATGRTAESLEVRMSKTGAALWGNENFEQLEFGRKPGNVSIEGTESIKQWILARRLINPGYKQYQLNSMAYAIKRKIEIEGFNRANHGGVGLISEVLTDERLEKIVKYITPELTDYYKSEVIAYLEAIFINKK